MLAPLSGRRAERRFELLVDRRHRRLDGLARLDLFEPRPRRRRDGLGRQRLGGRERLTEAALAQRHLDAGDGRLDRGVAGVGRQLAHAHDRLGARQQAVDDGGVLLVGVGVDDGAGERPELARQLGKRRQAVALVALQRREVEAVAGDLAHLGELGGIRSAAIHRPLEVAEFERQHDALGVALAIGFGLQHFADAALELAEARRRRRHRRRDIGRLGGVAAHGVERRLELGDLVLGAARDFVEAIGAGLELVDALGRARDVGLEAGDFAVEALGAGARGFGGLGGRCETRLDLGRHVAPRRRQAVGQRRFEIGDAAGDLGELRDRPGALRVGERGGRERGKPLLHPRDPLGIAAGARALRELALQRLGFGVEPDLAFAEALDRRRDGLQRADAVLDRGEPLGEVGRYGGLRGLLRGLLERARRRATSGDGVDASGCSPGMNGAASSTSNAPAMPAAVCETKRPSDDGSFRRRRCRGRLGLADGGAGLCRLRPLRVRRNGCACGSNFGGGGALLGARRRTAAAPAVAPARAAAGSGFTSTALPSIVACGRFGPGPSVVLLIDVRSSSYARRLPAQSSRGPRRKTCARPSPMKSPVSLDGKALVVQPATNPLDHIHERAHRRPVRHFDGDVSEGRETLGRRHPRGTRAPLPRRHPPDPWRRIRPA